MYIRESERWIDVSGRGLQERAGEALQLGTSFQCLNLFTDKLLHNLKERTNEWSSNNKDVTRNLLRKKKTPKEVF